MRSIKALIAFAWKCNLHEKNSPVNVVSELTWSAWKWYPSTVVFNWADWNVQLESICANKAQYSGNGINSFSICWNWEIFICRILRSSGDMPIHRMKSSTFKNADTSWTNCSGYRPIEPSIHELLVDVRNERPRIFWTAPCHTQPITWKKIFPSASSISSSL